MHTRLASSLFVLACAATIWSCSGGSMPSSPSMVNPFSAPGGGNGRLRTLDDPPAATPMAVVISIISSFGSGAFMPNPTTANMGDAIVFSNNDMVQHHIVLDDGTDLGDVMPGGSTAPVALTTPTQSFHCTLHPTMIGVINGPLPADPYYPPEPPPYDYYRDAFN